MSSKKTLLLLLAVAIVGGIAWYYTGPYQDRLRSSYSSRTESDALGDVAADRLSKIEVITPDGETHTLVKNNGAWSVAPNNWPAEALITNALLEKLQEIQQRPLTVVSVNPENKPRFEVDEANGTHVKLYQGDALLTEFIAGKIAPNYAETYITRPNDDTTYSTPVTLVRALDVESWRDHTIANLNDKAIDTVVLDYPGTEPVTLTTKEDTTGEIYWRAVAEPPVRLDAGKVADWLPALATLEARDIPPQDTAVTRQLTLRFSGEGIDEALVIGQKDPQTGFWYVKQESTGRLFLITDEDKQRLFKTVEDLR